MNAITRFFVRLGFLYESRSLPTFWDRVDQLKNSSGQYSLYLYRTSPRIDLTTDQAEPLSWEPSRYLMRYSVSGVRRRRPLTERGFSESIRIEFGSGNYRFWLTELDRATGREFQREAHDMQIPAEITRADVEPTPRVFRRLKFRRYEVAIAQYRESPATIWFTHYRGSRDPSERKENRYLGFMLAPLRRVRGKPEWRVEGQSI